MPTTASDSFSSGNVKPLSQQAGAMAESAGDSASNALHSTQSATNEAFDRMSDKVDDAKNLAAPLISRLTAQAEAAARRGADVVRDTSAQLKEKASMAQETTVGYIKDEPMKAILIAAATGAALMGLISLMTRSGSED